MGQNPRPDGMLYVIYPITGCNWTGPSQAEQLLRVTSGIAAELIKAHNANETVSLNEIRAKISKKFGYGGVPRLVDIISAIPDEYKKALLPKLKARPIRTASGVSDSLVLYWRLPQIAAVAVMSARRQWLETYPYTVLADSSYMYFRFI